MSKKDLLAIVLLSIIYLFALFFRSPEIFSYRFSRHVVDSYLHSQDITHEVTGRIFLSDSDGNNALGYLYIHGGDPVWYNFQHGPFIKYLYGFGTHFLGNPYIIQMLFGLLLLIMVYLFGKKWSTSLHGFLAGMFLIGDPLFLSLSAQFLLDLGQTAFLFLYLYLVLFHKKSWLAQGMVLGILCASKFWAAPLFFFMILQVFLFVTKRFHFRTLFFHLITAAVIFTLVYIRSFIVAGGFFNIIFFELKTIKFWLTQSVSSSYGASFLLFMTGYLKTWWGDHAWARANVWWFLWPISLLLSTWYGVVHLLKGQRTWMVLCAVIPALYLLYTSVQAPFERYFIMILPFLYLTVSHLFLKILHRHTRSLS